MSAHVTRRAILLGSMAAGAISIISAAHVAEWAELVLGPVPQPRPALAQFPASEHGDVWAKSDGDEWVFAGKASRIEVIRDDIDTTTFADLYPTTIRGFQAGRSSTSLTMIADEIGARELMRRNAPHVHLLIAAGDAFYVAERSILRSYSSNLSPCLVATFDLGNITMMAAT